MSLILDFLLSEQGASFSDFRPYLAQSLLYLAIAFIRIPVAADFLRRLVFF